MVISDVQSRSAVRLLASQIMLSSDPNSRRDLDKAANN